MKNNPSTKENQHNSASLMEGILKNLFLFIISIAVVGVQAVFAANQTVAVLPSEGILKDEELIFFTDKAQEIAVQALPKSSFEVFPRDVIIKRLGGVDNYVKECKESSCIVELGRKAMVDYVAQCSFGKLGSDLTVSFELYNVSTEGLIDKFVDKAKNADGLLAIMQKKIPDSFMKIPGASSVSNETSGAENDAEAYYKRGEEYLEEEDYDKAISEFTEAIRLNPKYAEAYSKRGAAYANKGDYDIAMSDYNEAIRLKPNYAEAYSDRGIMYAGKGNYDKALSDLNKAIRLNPKYARAYYHRGYVYSIKGDHNKAISDCNEAIRLKPDDTAYGYRGYVYSIKGDHNKAISDYTEAIRLNPNLAKTYARRGLAYYNKGDYDNAISDYSEAIRLNPNDARAYFNRGLAYVIKKDYDSAISDFDEVLRLNPNDEKAYINRGLMYAKKEDYDSVISDYSEAIRLKPNYADVYLARGFMYAEKGDYDSAISDYSEAIRLKPNDAEAYNTRGNAYAYKGDYDSAISNYNEAIRLKPNDADTYLVRGLTYAEKGDYNKAIADYKSALRIDPNYSDAKNALSEAQEALGNKTASPSVTGKVSGGLFTDKRDGKKYRAVKIGDQIWMAENLNYAANGSTCYNNNSGNCAKYGRLYDWNTAMNSCPSGWHLPSKSEYEALDNVVGGEEVAGKKLKAKSGWSNGGNGTDEYGFSALPGGYGNSDDYFIDVGELSRWWSASEYNSYNAYYRYMYYDYEHAGWNYNGKSYLFSVRCVQGPPIYEPPTYEQPIYKQPTYEQPTYKQPTYKQPTYEPPTYEQPTYKQPTYKQPTYKKPTNKQPKKKTSYSSSSESIDFSKYAEIGWQYIWDMHHFRWSRSWLYNTIGYKGLEGFNYELEWIVGVIYRKGIIRSITSGVGLFGGLGARHFLCDDYDRCDTGTGDINMRHELGIELILGVFSLYIAERNFYRIGGGIGLIF